MHYLIVSSSQTYGLSLLPFCRWGSERLSHLPKVTQPVNDWAGTQSPADWLQSLWASFFYALLP